MQAFVFSLLIGSLIFTLAKKPDGNRRRLSWGKQLLEQIDIEDGPTQLNDIKTYFVLAAQAATRFLGRIYNSEASCWRYQFFFANPAFGDLQLTWVESCTDEKEPSWDRPACISRQLGTLEAMARYRLEAHKQEALGFNSSEYADVDRMVTTTLQMLARSPGHPNRGLPLSSVPINNASNAELARPLWLTADNNEMTVAFSNSIAAAAALQWQAATGDHQFSSFARRWILGLLDNVSIRPDWHDPQQYHGNGMIWYYLAVSHEILFSQLTSPTATCDVEDRTCLHAGGLVERLGGLLDEADVAMEKTALAKGAWSFYAAKASALRARFITDLLRKKVAPVTSAELPLLDIKAKQLIALTNHFVDTAYNRNDALDGRAGRYVCGLPLEGIAPAAVTLASQVSDAVRNRRLRNGIIRHMVESVYNYQITKDMNKNTHEWKMWIKPLNRAQWSELHGAFFRDYAQMTSEEGRESIRPDDVTHCLHALLSTLQLMGTPEAGNASYS